jgi:hypothetical protein
VTTLRRRYRSEANPSNDVLAAGQMPWDGGPPVHSVAPMLQGHIERAVLRAPVEAHRYAIPVVREISAPPPPRPRTQRLLVAASLMLCDREDASRHRRWA